MSKATSELASTPTQSVQTSLSLKKPAAKKTKKKPDMYVFRLVREHPKTHEGSSIFPPRYIITNQDNVLFNYGTDDEPDFRPRQIRYLDGYPTIFVDEQEEKGNITDAVTGNPKNIISFDNGHLVVPAWNKPLYDFLMSCNQCEQNKNKLKQVKNTYRLLDFANSDVDVVEIGKRKDLAYDMARNSSLDEMIPHAKFLGISFVHASTGEERDWDAVREDYKSKALENPENFLLFVNNPRIKTIFLIEKGLERGIITTSLVKGQLHWMSSKQLITPLDTSKSAKEAIADFATTEEGDSFVKTLKVQLSM